MKKVILATALVVGTISFASAKGHKASKAFKKAPTALHCTKTVVVTTGPTTTTTTTDCWFCSCSSL